MSALTRAPRLRQRAAGSRCSTSATSRSPTAPPAATSAPSADVDLALAPGEIVGLAGESGCGKSTLAYGSVPAAAPAGGDHRRQRHLPRPARRRGGASTCSAQTAPQLRALRWREIAIVFQSAMNALNPVLRIGDQLRDALDAHLPLGTRGAAASAVASSCSSSSGSRARACAATRTSCRAGCASG